MDEDQSSTAQNASAARVYTAYVPGKGRVFAETQEELDKLVETQTNPSQANIEQTPSSGTLPPGAAATTIILAMLIGLWAFASRSEASRQNRNAFFEASISGLSECLDFWGRTSRADYWRFQLFSFLVCGSVSFIEGAIKGRAGGVGLILNALFWIPGMALTVRRRHDLGLDGYPFIVCGWAILSIYAVGIIDNNTFVIGIGGLCSIAFIAWWLFWAFKPGDHDQNRFGSAQPSPPSQIQSPSSQIVQTDKPVATTSGGAPLQKSAPVPNSEVAAQSQPTDPYELAGQEILTGKLDASAWARALVEGNGVDGAVRAAYVKLRVGALQAEPAQSQNSSTNEVRANSDLVKSYAASHSVTLVEAQAMISQAERTRALGIKKEGEKYFFVGKSDGKKWLYDNLADAIWAAERDF
jgi:uncharacterized membrane protein YhaH (DUF805 family)